MPTLSLGEETALRWIVEQVQQGMLPDRFRVAVYIGGRSIAEWKGLPGSLPTAINASTLRGLVQAGMLQNGGRDAQWTIYQLTETGRSYPHSPHPHIVPVQTTMRDVAGPVLSGNIQQVTIEGPRSPVIGPLTPNQRALLCRLVRHIVSGELGETFRMVWYVGDGKMDCYIETDHRLLGDWKSTTTGAMRALCRAGALQEGTWDEKGEMCDFTITGAGYEYGLELIRKEDTRAE